MGLQILNEIIFISFFRHFITSSEDARWCSYAAFAVTNDFITVRNGLLASSSKPGIR
jgi:hypothetical protein